MYALLQLVSTKPKDVYNFMSGLQICISDAVLVGTQEPSLIEVASLDWSPLQSSLEYSRKQILAERAPVAKRQSAMLPNFMLFRQQIEVLNEAQ
jgi:hypothetical protein